MLPKAEYQPTNLLPDTLPSGVSPLPHFQGESNRKCHYSGANIHTMTIRRILVSCGLRGELFFYSQLKDIDSITGSSQSSREG